MKYFWLLLMVFSLCSCSKVSSPRAFVTPPVVVTPPVTVKFVNKLPTVLKESSGLCYTDGALWTFGDSGNPNAIYKIDSSTGEILQTVTVKNFPNIDWEDITADSNFIYIGDFGNNDGNRKDLKIIRIKKSNLAEATALISVTGEAIRFSYHDQTSFPSTSRSNFDCESLIAVGNSLYIFTKDEGDLKTRCYKVPKTPGSYDVTAISSFDTGGEITSAAYNPQTREVVLLGYRRYTEESFLWFLNDYSGDDFFSGSKQKLLIGSLFDWQTEGISYVSPTRLFLTCETTPHHAAALYFIQKNPE